jgi:hypothetical protein
MFERMLFVCIFFFLVHFPLVAWSFDVFTTISSAAQVDLLLPLSGFFWRY